MILIRVQDIVGKESAKVGQGKAFKEGWITKDKDTLKIKVHHLFLKLTEDELIGYRQIRLRMQVGSNSRSFRNPEHTQIRRSSMI